MGLKQLEHRNECKLYPKPMSLIHYWGHSLPTTAFPPQPPHHSPIGCYSPAQQSRIYWDLFLFCGLLFQCISDVLRFVQLFKNSNRNVFTKTTTTIYNNDEFISFHFIFNYLYMVHLRDLSFHKDSESSLTTLDDYIETRL